jgi:hypothetical protein
MSHPDLGMFEARRITETRIKVTNAGDGLSQAVEVDPQVLHHGETVHVVLECTVDKVTLEPIKDEPAALARVHVLKAGAATIVPADLVTDLLADQQDRIRRARQAADGQEEMF